MSAPYLSETQTDGNWHAAFAFQVVHHPAEQWAKMRWGFNAAALLEEALDRCKLFVESQSVNEPLFFDNEQPIRTLALRGINFPNRGVQMALLGKTTAPSHRQAEQAGADYAREIFSIFPHDFVLHPAKNQTEYYDLAGSKLMDRKPQIASILRGRALIPPMRIHQELRGCWHATARSNEQIWRALSRTPQIVMLNIFMQPAFLFENEKERLIQIKHSVLDAEKKPDPLLPYHAWLEEYIKRRLAPWKKFFDIQIHMLFEDVEDDNLLRAIGSALTRDTDAFPLPGYEIRRPASETEKIEWLDAIQSLTLPRLAEMDNLADLDEAFAVFRFPFRPEAGLPGSNFIAPPDVG